MAEAVIDVQHVFKHYRNRRALENVTLRVDEGEIVALLGPNGGGKTTLFRILATLMRHDGGFIRVCGFDPAREPMPVRRAIGVVFQSPSLDRKLTGRENLRHHGHLYGLSGQPLAHRIEEVLGWLGVLERADDIVETLSGGLARRVEIAKGMLPAPRLLLLDEPSTGLDPTARRDLWDTLDRLRREQCVTVLLTTHILDEADRCDRVALIDRGRVVANGPPAELVAKVGGDVITVSTDQPEALVDRIRSELDLSAEVVNGRVHLETDQAAEKITGLARLLGDGARSLTWSQPSLEDVFLHLTGHAFEPVEDGS